MNYVCGASSSALSPATMIYREVLDSEIGPSISFNKLKNTRELNLNVGRGPELWMLDRGSAVVLSDFVGLLLRRSTSIAGLRLIELFRREREC